MCNLPCSLGWASRRGATAAVVLVAVVALVAMELVGMRAVEALVAEPRKPPC